VQHLILATIKINNGGSMLEIILGIAGVWILIVGRVPTWIIGKKDFEITGMKARLIGLILALPFPFSFVTGMILALLFGQDGVSYAFFVEIAIFITVLIVVMILTRKFRIPVVKSANQ
jgi:ABC-type sulfate transport system permease subunit